MRPGKEFSSQLGHAYLSDIGVLDGLYPRVKEEGDSPGVQQTVDYAKEGSAYKLSSYGNMQAGVMLAAVASLVPHVNRLLAKHCPDQDALQMISSIQLIRLYALPRI